MSILCTEALKCKGQTFPKGYNKCVNALDGEQVGAASTPQLLCISATEATESKYNSALPF
jgi:hypothetical protein